MTATGLYRTVAVLFVLFALGHTVGFLRFVPSTPDGVAVRDAMATVTLKAGMPRFTYGGIYRGFGLYITIYLAFSIYLAWYLGDLARSAPSLIGGLGWMFVAVQLAGLALSWIYFSAPPTVFSAVIAALLAAATWIARGASSTAMRGL